MPKRSEGMAWHFATRAATGEAPAPETTHWVGSMENGSGIGRWVPWQALRNSRTDRQFQSVQSAREATTWPWIRLGGLRTGIKRQKATPDTPGSKTPGA